MTQETVLYVGAHSGFRSLASSLEQSGVGVVRTPDVGAAAELLAAVGAASVDGGQPAPLDFEWLDDDGEPIRPDDSTSLAEHPLWSTGDGDTAPIDCLVVESAGGPLDELFETLSNGPESPPVVVVGPDEEGAAEAAFDGGADDYLPESAAAFDRRLTNTVERALAKRLADRERRDASARFEAFFADTESANVILDTAGRVKATNQTAIAFVAADEDDVIGTPLWELPWIDHSEADPDEVEAAVDAAGAGQAKRLVIRGHDATGVFRSGEVRFRPIERDGEVDGVLVEARDISELLGETGPVPESPAQRLRTIVDNVPLVLFALDPEGTFTLSEGRGLERLGLEPGEIVGESIHDVYADNEDILEACTRALAGEHVETTVEQGDLVFDVWLRPVFESTPRTPAGPGNATASGDAERQVRSVIGAAIDVTDRVQRERELEQYEAMLEAVPDGVFVIDERGVIVGGNERAAQEAGFNRDELIGKPFIELAEEGVVTWDLIREYEAVLPELLSSKNDREETRFEIDMYPPDGSHRIMEGHLSLLPYDEEFRGMIGVNRDITERKRQERELRRQNERLEQFASVVSHDLRNPLNVAQGYVDLLADALEGVPLDEIASGIDGEQIGTAIEETDHSLDRMERLIEDLLELARTGEAVTDPETVSLRSVAEHAWASVASSGADLEIESSTTLEADRDRLLQLFENLYRNAVEHGSESVTVTVGALDGEPGFYVTDDGPGIPESDRESVFDYGYSTEADGTGFGLAIVAEIADAHGWSVDLAESESGGARFEFRDAHRAS